MNFFCLGQKKVKNIETEQVKVSIKAQNDGHILIFYLACPRSILVHCLFSTRPSGASNSLSWSRLYSFSGASISSRMTSFSRLVK